MANGGKKNRKWGRNKVKCANYRASGRRELNKARKAATLARRLAKAKDRREALNWLEAVTLGSPIDL